MRKGILRRGDVQSDLSRRIPSHGGSIQWNTVLLFQNEAHLQSDIKRFIMVSFLKSKVQRSTKNTPFMDRIEKGREEKE